jgi:5-methylcytosine-specific restriction endonuclease McrA
MASRDWLARREAWREQWIASHGVDPVCQICGQPWTLSGSDLHHRTYARLGHEDESDLIPLCRRPCHERLHQILESNPAWLKTGRAHATDTIVARLRTKAHAGASHG